MYGKTLQLWPHYISQFTAKIGRLGGWGKGDKRSEINAMGNRKRELKVETRDFTGLQAIN